MTNRYEEKLEAKRDRLLERADKARAESSAAYASSHRITDGIPMGQPILVGHHSEKRHRRDLARADATMRKSIDASDRAADLAHRADAVGTAGISSDDPEAIVKLNAELEDAERARLEEKRWNGEIRKLAKARSKALGHALTQGDHIELVAKLLELHCPPGIIRGLTSQARAFPWLPQFGNHTQANVKRIQKRIDDLKVRDSKPERSIDGPGWKLDENKAENRTQIAFEGKPDEAMRDKLKGAGFRWAPSIGVWQRHLSEQAWYRACVVLGVDPTTCEADIKATCGCPADSPEADPAIHACPCGAHCTTCSTDRREP